jgi:hypothetical protein
MDKPHHIGDDRMGYGREQRYIKSGWEGEIESKSTARPADVHVNNQWHSCSLHDRSAELLRLVE